MKTAIRSMNSFNLIMINLIINNFSLPFRFMPDSYSYPTRNQQKQSSDSSDGETLRTEFRRPRDTLLTIVYVN